jgi:formate dehydrogenase major subunit
VQGGGDMGAIPNKLPGFQDIEKDVEARDRFERAWDVPIMPTYGWHLTHMFEAMGRGELTAVYCIGENPATSEADQEHAVHLLEGLDTLIVQDLTMTATAELADVVFPASNASFEADGTVTNSERRVQRVRKALEPPGEAKDDIWIIAQLAKRMGVDWGDLTAQEAWDELRSLSPMHTLMSWEHIEELGGIQWPCNEEFPDGAQFLHERLWRFDDPERQGAKAPFSVVIDEPPVDELNEEFPMRLTTGRRLESFNTGVQTNQFDSPLHRGESLDLCPEDAEALGVSEGERVRIVSRRGAIEAPIHVTTALRPGLAFMTFHFPDEVATNQLTIEAYDPKSGTSEFKATAIRVEKLNGHRSEVAS